ncbi:hypothetical protein A5893_17410 [Pedobacter psychrophilus]|uniref:Uncharacterized protein n=2 Tax=Pedobacter psychrophilus TaxID=1826909 RepID=A0A179DJ16_9SPHI|nr:hypothetical protein A5893_17410 [Pedobacter psychrophilus]
MKPFTLIFISTLLLTGVCYSQTKSFQVILSPYQNDHPTEVDEPQIYRLRKQALNADFNIVKLTNLDNHRKDSISLREIFEPVNGNYIYYQFVSTFNGRALVFPGEDLKDSIKIFHDILIVKTNNQNEIIDAFQYTLEWAERPCQYDLYKSSNTSNVTLTENMEISTLKFVRTEYWDENDKFLKEKGTIKMK